MATITLKDIPEDLHLALKERARKHGRSLNKEVLACLEAAAAPQLVDVESLLADIRRHRASIPGKLTDKLLREARETGRP
ncbi:Arc family DNA-binding protein [Desulfobacterota bacterium AH_259_B03_O07]|nr:Arc family DNA-binding protein [Desulfobacterota bacterium AH_259_B03_O07]